MREILGFLLYIFVFVAGNYAAEEDLNLDSERQKQLQERREEDLEYNKRVGYAKLIVKDKWEDISNKISFTYSDVGESWNIDSIYFGSSSAYPETQLTSEQIKSQENLSAILASRVIFHNTEISRIVSFQDGKYGYARLSFEMLPKPKD